MQDDAALLLHRPQVVLLVVTGVIELIICINLFRFLDGEESRVQCYKDLLTFTKKKQFSLGDIYSRFK